MSRGAKVTALVGLIALIIAMACSIALNEVDAQPAPAVIVTKLPNGWTKLKDYGERTVCYQAPGGCPVSCVPMLK